MFNLTSKKNLEELQKVILEKEAALENLEKKFAELKKNEDSLQKKLKDSEKEINALSKAKDQAITESKDAQKQITELKTAHDSALKKVKDQVITQSNDAQKRITELNTEYESALKKVKDQVITESKEAQKQITELKTAHDSALKKVKDQAITELKTEHESALKKIKDHAISELKTVKDKVVSQEFKVKELEEKNRQLEKIGKTNYDSSLQLKEACELLKNKLKATQEELEQEKAQKSKVAKESNENFNNYKKTKTLNQYAKKKIEDQVREQELLLIQISQLTEEYNKVSLQVKTLNALNKTLVAKLKRLMSRVPDYVDFGGIEFVSQDSVSEIPQILWRITDYSYGSVVLPEFYFRTCLQDGLAGIVVAQNPTENISGPVLIPQLLGKSPEQLDLFKSISGEHWQQIKAAAAVLEQLLQSKGQSLQNSADFDFGFWQNSLGNLVATIKRLPSLLRFKQAKLKRELQNPDYEHLWIELYDVEFGEFHCPKLEFRLGASMIQVGDFSKHPKLEFPLINGKLKPFESWFSESSDDFGPKFELRFSLEKQVFDIGTFLKLSDTDQRLMQALIVVIPTVLIQLMHSKISIHRKWETWTTFSEDIIKVFQVQTRAANPSIQDSPKTSESPTASALALSAPVAKLSISAAPAADFSQVPTRSVKSKPVTVMVMKKTPKKTPLNITNKAKKLPA